MHRNKKLEALQSTTNENFNTRDAGEKTKAQADHKNPLLTGQEQNPRSAEPAVSKKKSHLFQPGQSGNPAGRPPRCFHKMMEKLLAGKNQKYARELAISLTEDACRGNANAIKELLAIVGPKP